ncbi:GNAT family N-acetyltransferase [Kribbella flavida]|nr:GNAT family N-acetyltransferase [Kribbella flavida]
MTAERVLVRPAAEADDPALLALDSAAWDSSSGFPSFRAALRGSFFTERAGPQSYLVAELGGDVVGYVKLQDKYQFAEGAGVLEVAGLAVSPTARGKGIGSTLLDAVATEAKQRGARKISLYVFETNTSAQRLYERHGYVVEGRRIAEFVIDGAPRTDLSLAKYL